MKTRIALLQRDLGTVVVKHINGWEMFLIVSGVVFWALVCLAIARSWIRHSEWLTEQPPDDIPAFVVCTCVTDTYYGRRYTNPKCPLHGLNTNAANHTATLSVAEFRQVDGDAS